MYLNIDKHSKNSLAAIDSDGNQVSYGELCNIVISYKRILQNRSVVFLLCENSVGALCAYMACIENRCVPLIISSKIDRDLLNSLISIYMPTYLWMPCRLDLNVDIQCECKLIDSNYGYDLFQTGYKQYKIYKELALLLSTSGSTGSPKLVRHSYYNLDASAKNVAKFFKISSTDRALADLPMFYTMGHSVITSHLYAGATLLLTSLSILSKEFWEFFSENNITTFTGVPYSYQLLQRLKFTHKKWPSLKILTQGGGKMSEKLYREFSEYAAKNNILFIPTFGQTECTARMAYLNPSKSLYKVGCIGNAIPEGRLFLVDVNGEKIYNQDIEGELGYSGPNVTLGYAQRKEDLLKGDEWKGSILTGDIAICDSDGDYYIVGRKKRFLKLYGYRVSLDQCEKLIKNEFNIDCVCVGNDERMIIYLENNQFLKDVAKFLSKKTGIVVTAFKVVLLDCIPRNEYGKIIYKDLEKRSIEK